MAFIFDVIIVFAAAFVGLTLVFLCLPLCLELVVSKDEAVRVKAAVRPFGRAGPRISVVGRKKKPAKDNHATPSSQTKRKTWPRHPQRLVPAGFRLISDILKCIRLHSVNMDLHFGTGDPAETGEAFGHLAALTSLQHADPRVRINVMPDFDQAVLNGLLRLNVSVVPVRLILPIARFVWIIFGARR